jgi:hypothetical protein
VRRLPYPAPTVEGFLHPDDSSLGSHVVVELIDTGQNGFDKSSDWGIVDSFCSGLQVDSEPRQKSAYRVMVGSVAGETRKRMDNDCVDTSPMLLTEIDQFQEFRPLNCLGGLTALDERPGHLKPLSLAVLAAHALLRWQTQVLCLLTRRDAAVDDGPHEGVRSLERVNWLIARRSAFSRDSLPSNSRIAARSSMLSRSEAFIRLTRASKECGEDGRARRITPDMAYI